MGLEIQKKRDGSLKSNWWYGRFEVEGKNHCVNLGVEIKGRIPKTLRKQGDMEFECSRTLAAAKMKALLAEAHNWSLRGFDRSRRVADLQERHNVRGPQ